MKSLKSHLLTAKSLKELVLAALVALVCRYGKAEEPSIWIMTSNLGPLWFCNTPSGAYWLSIGLKARTPLYLLDFQP